MDSDPSSEQAAKRRRADEVPATMPAPDLMMGMSRSMVTMMQFNEQKQDYTTSLESLEENSAEYEESIRNCHNRGAERCANVARLQGGLYVKAAQFLASIRGGTGDRGIPKPYIDALSIFTDEAPHKTIEEVSPLLKECMSLGSWPQQPLDEACDLRKIDPKPVASGSLAQVHIAELKDGSKVAVKVQYPALQKEMASDFAVFKTMGAQIKQMAAGYDVMWLVEDFERNMARELNFGLEASSGEETAKQLAHLAPSVHVPKVLRQFSSSQVLVTEYCEGMIKCNDPVALQAAGLDVQECAELICSTFAEMIFFHGRVHADPHAGNIYMRAIDGKPQLVVLDHGLYHDLSEDNARLKFCHYWKACCCKDVETMNRFGAYFAGALHRFLPLILSPWFLVGSSVSLKEIVSAAQGVLPDTIGLRDVADFVAATRNSGTNLLGVLHSLGYVRGILEELGFPEGKRVAIFLKYATLGDTSSPELVPCELTRRQEAWIRWQTLKLGGKLRLMAPVAKLLMRFSIVDFAVPFWLVAGTGTALAACVAIKMRNKIQNDSGALC